MAPRKWIASAALGLLFAMPLPFLQPEARAQAPAAGAERIVDIRVVARKPEGGARTVRVQRGERLTLRIRADEKLVVHVHGYDLQGEVLPGETASIPVTAQWVGRFPVTAHLGAKGSGHHGPEPTLAYLEVRPE